MARTATMLATLLIAYLDMATAQQASTPTLSLPFFGFDTQTIDASVVSATAQGATTLMLGCPKPTMADTCGLYLGADQFLTVGPSTYVFDVSDTDFTIHQDCNTAAATCVESAGGAEANFPGMSTTSYDRTDVATLPVVVTAGAEKLMGGAGASASVTSGSRASMMGGMGVAPKTSDGSTTATTSAQATPSGGGACSVRARTGAAGIFAVLAYLGANLL